MAADILVFPGMQSESGLAEGSDLLAQDFLLAMLNYGEARPYLPAPPPMPITQILLQSGNVPPLSEIAMAFNLSLPGIRNIMLKHNPGYQGARLVDIRNGDNPGSVSMTIQVKTTAEPIYIQKTLTIGTLDG